MYIHTHESVGLHVDILCICASHISLSRVIIKTKVTNNGVCSDTEQQMVNADIVED